MTNLENKYKKHSVSESELLILPPAIALEMIDDCKKEGLRILGVDGFLITDNSTISPLEHILDISNQRSGSHETAKEFIISRKSGNLFFEVTYN
jgi:hypothetical protein